MAKMVKVDERAYGPGPRDDIQTLVAVPGDEISEAEAERLGVRTVVPGRQRDRDADGVREIGGGWFELPNGERVQGEDAARERLRALRASQDEVTNHPSDFTAGAVAGLSGVNRPAGDTNRGAGTAGSSGDADQGDQDTEVPSEEGGATRSRKGKKS